MKVKACLAALVVGTAFALFFSGCGGTLAIREVSPVPKDRPLYGFTASGVFFIHESVIANTGAKSALFVSEVTSQLGRRMTIKNGYWIYDVNRIASDQVDFERYSGKGLAVRYCFIIGNNLQIPRDVMDKTDWIAKDDIAEVKGIPFISTRPVENKYVDTAPSN